MSDITWVPEPPRMGKLHWSTEIGEIAAALAKAQGVMESAPKLKKNPYFKSTYADLPIIRKCCKEPLTTNNIAFIQSPSLDGDQVSVHTLLMHSSGQWVCGVSSCKATKNVEAQAVGSAITYLKRYSLAAMLGIVDHEDDDGNAATSDRATNYSKEVSRETKNDKSPPAKKQSADKDKNQRTAKMLVMFQRIGVEIPEIETYIKKKVTELDHADLILLADWYQGLKKITESNLEQGITVP